MKEGVNRPLSKLESEADILRRKIYSDIDDICELLTIQKNFGFSETQMTYFKASLAHDKLNKQAGYAVGWTKDPNYIPNLNIVARGFLVSKVPYQNEVNNLALAKLRRAMEDRKDKLIPEEYPKSGAIRNAANQTAVILVKCDDSGIDIKEEFDKKLEFLKTKVLGL